MICNAALPLIFQCCQYHVGKNELSFFFVQGHTKERVHEISRFDIVGGSAITPASAARNCAVDRRIAEPIGVTDVRVQ